MTGAFPLWKKPNWVSCVARGPLEAGSGPRGCGGGSIVCDEDFEESP